MCCNVPVSAGKTLQGYCRDVIRGKPKSAADSNIFYTELLDLRVLFSDDVGFGAGSDWMSLCR